MCISVLANKCASLCPAELLQIFLLLQLGRALFNHLKVYKGPDHPHEAQKPIDLPIRDKRIQLQK